MFCALQLTPHLTFYNHAKCPFKKKYPHRLNIYKEIVFFYTLLHCLKHYKTCDQDVCLELHYKMNLTSIESLLVNEHPPNIIFQFWQTLGPTLIKVKKDSPTNLKYFIYSIVIACLYNLKRNPSPEHFEKKKQKHWIEMLRYVFCIPP